MRSLASTTPQLTPASRSPFNLEERSGSPKKKPSVGALSPATTPTGPRPTRITATAAIASRSTTPLSRHPPKPCDQNVATATRFLTPVPTTPIPTLPTTLREMAPEKLPGTNSSRQSPMPTLAKGLSKQPLTPKIAARTTRALTPAATTQHQAVTVAATPLGRRPARPESALSSSSGVVRERDEVASPVSAFLSSNITPRSGSRQSRVDGFNVTPGGTPVPDRFEPREARSSPGVSGSGVDSALKRPAAAFSSPPEAAGSTRKDADSKFFYASDAQRQSQQSSTSKPFVAQQQKPPTFLYANGEMVSGRQDAPTLAPPTLTPALESTIASQGGPTSKFVYACGVTGQPWAGNPTIPLQSGTGSATSAPSRLPTSRPVGTAALPTGYLDARPVSPVKQLAFQAAKEGPNPSVVAPRSLTAASVASSAPPNLRRSSGGINVRFSSTSSHSRNNSIAADASAPAPAVARFVSAHGSHASGTSSPSGTALGDVAPEAPGSDTGAVSGFASFLQAAEGLVEEDEVKSAVLSEVMQSPTKPSPQDSQLHELVENARRERKEQDLQIRNASLEAINRTLERQLRKQTAELRRYRRLSRSGRLSLVSTSSLDRVVSSSTVDGGALARAGMGLDDLSEQESEDAEDELLDEEEDDISDSDTGSGELSPGALALRDARHRERDEKRLQLDLSKHRQLLIDSQRMNQSLRRCLSWTEQLIKEGKRALQYEVRVSEVQIGGRVLAPEDVEGQDADHEAAENHHQEDAMDGDVEDDTIHETNLRLDNSLDAFDSLAVNEGKKNWSKDPQDRDSGIELPGDAG